MTTCPITQGALALLFCGWLLWLFWRDLTRGSDRGKKGTTDYKRNPNE
jgi:hypothetical protein